MSPVHKTACVIIIGNEILTGRTQDINLAYIGKKLLEKGVRLLEARVIADIEEAIVAAVNELRAKYDYVFTTGGIGPTHDDITADSIAKAFGVANEVNALARTRLVSYYKGEEHLNEGRLRMARIPEGASLIDNPVSAAPGFKIGNVHVLAGIPNVMQAMMDSIAPNLQGGPAIKSRTIGCFIGESIIAREMGEIAAQFPELDIGSYPYFRSGGYGLSLVIRGTNTAQLDAVQAALCSLITRHGGEPVVQAEEASP
ncbi:MAG: competence/damage-inducible protein A [Alphaproteobacteria bacterium]|nr:competence/damage-inducible protein A [Alphaproteobacteria bacterium]